MNKKIAYICIDDEKTLAGRILNKIAANDDRLAIETSAPLNFEDQSRDLIRLHAEGKLDGLLLDLRLDDRSEAGKPSVSYNALALAAHLRNWLAVSKHKVVGFPIILWSIENKLAKSFAPDSLNKDLFDAVYHKECFPQQALPASRQLAEHVVAYRHISEMIRKNKGLSEILEVPKGVDLDVRIADYFGKRLKDHPTHSIAQFVFSDLVQQPGPLVDELVLLAILGVDEASPGKDRLLKRLDKDFSYRGPFSSVWTRWWLAPIEHWFRSVTPKSSLARMDSSERVEVLKKILRIKDLEPAKPIGKSYSPYFSTICEVKKEPLDPIDGFVIMNSGKRPWQRKRYVCKEVALNPARHNFREGLTTQEEDRVRRLKNIIKHHGK